MARAGSDLVAAVSANDSGNCVTMISSGEVEKARSYAEASRAASTLFSYTGDWKAFTLWCRERQLAPCLPIPASSPCSRRPRPLAAALRRQ